MFATTRFRTCGIAFLILAFACAAAPARAALPASWGAGTVQPVPPAPGSHFGESIINAGDLNGDGLDDVVVSAPDFADPPPASPVITGRVYAFSTFGNAIWGESAPSLFEAGNVPGSKPTRFGAKLARLGDLGRCTPLGEATCTVGPPDQISEIAVSAPGTDTGGAAGQDQGAVYVLDGKTGRLLKALQLGEKSPTGNGGAAFGKSLLSLSSQPPCDGVGGVGTCTYPSESKVAMGDVNGEGKPDFVVGAPDFTEDLNSLEGRCATTCPRAGRVYIFYGEAITGSSQDDLTELDTGAAATLTFPGPVDGDSPQFGGAFGAVGDVGACRPTPPEIACVTSASPPSREPDDLPDVAVAAPGLDTTEPDAGAVFLIDPSANTVISRMEDPGPAADGAFGSFAQVYPAPGDLNGDALPDVIVGVPRGEGKSVGFSGDVATPSPIASFTDPAPVSGGAFGAAAAGLGDIAGDAPAEIALGAAGGARPGAVHIASACANTILRTIVPPENPPAAGFGASIAPIGDRNNDGFIDLAVGAPGSDGGAGRIYTFTSTGPAGASFAGCGGSTGGGGTTGGTGSTGAGKAPPKVRARVLRRLTMKPSRRSLKRGAALRFRGSLKASAGQPGCQRRQKIAIQRRKLSGGRFQTFDVAVTARSGAFKASFRPGRSYVYRARVSQTSGCMGATSNRARVVVKRVSRASRARR